MVVQRVERAELLEQRDGGLLSHSRHARDVVRGVALQRLVVEHLVRPQPVALVDLGRVVDHRGGHAHAGGQQAHVVVDQLQPIEIAGDDVGVDVGIGRLPGQRADHVISLVAGQLADRHAHHRHQLAHDRELGSQVVWHARPPGLVLGVGIEAELRLADVEAHDGVVGLEVLHAAQHDLQEAEHGVHQRAIRGGQRGQREIAAIHEAGPVDEHQDRASIGHGQASLDR